MKFSIHQQVLNDVLITVNKAVSPRVTSPILAGVYIEALENEVIFRTTNLELSVSATVPALIEEDGSALLPAKLLSDIVSTFPQEAVSIEATQDNAEILCTKSNFNIRVLNALDFPEFPSVDTNQKVTLPYSDFSKMTKKVANMVARDDARPILQGVDVNVNNDSLELVATDGYRVAVAKSKIQTDNRSEFSAVIPGAFLMEIAGLKGDIQNATISLSENQVVVECNDYVFINRRIAGNFPNFKQVLPDSSTISAKLNSKALSEAVKRIGVLGGMAPVVRIEMDPANNLITLTGDAQDVGSCEESLDVQYSSDSDQNKDDILFNCNYIIDGLNCLNCKEVILDFVAKDKPAIFKSADDDESIYMLSPVKPK